MGFRFRRSIKVIPGLRLNLGASGMSLNAGIRGASVTLGSRGVYANMGIPGTGISSRTKIGSNENPSKPKLEKTLGAIRIMLQISDTGIVTFLSEDGIELPENIVKKIRASNSLCIEAAIDEYVENVNHDYNSCMTVYRNTPRRFGDNLIFPEPMPEIPKLEPIGFFRNIFGLAESKKSINLMRKNIYEEKLQHWTEQNNAWPNYLKKAHDGNPEAMEIILTMILARIPWPKEILINFDFENETNTLKLDVDLPEIEDMPRTLLSRAARGVKINVKNITESERRNDYAKMVHGIIFRIIGESFSVLRSVEEISISGFTQRISNATGIEENEYILSVKVRRIVWENLNLENIDVIDPVFALAKFQIVRDMKKNGELKKINPLE